MPVYNIIDSKKFKLFVIIPNQEMKTSLKTDYVEQNKMLNRNERE